MQAPILSERVTFLKNIPLFTNLNDEQLASLANDFRLREYRADEVIFHQDDRGNELYLIIKGKIRIFKICPPGKETSIQIFSTYDLIGEFAAIDDQPRSASAKALDTCHLLEMRGDDFLIHMRTMPDLSLNVARLLTKKVRWTASYAEMIAQYDAAARLLHMLMLYNEQFGQEIEEGKQYTLNLALNQTDLASMIGARREWVNRLLKDWLKRKLIAIEAGTITFLDWPKVLQEYNSRIELEPSKW